MIIDCHGHYTTAPAEVQAYRNDQLAHLGRGEPWDGPLPEVGDSELHDSIAQNQLAMMDRRGTDLTIISPKASAMGHHAGDLASAGAWARVNNDLIHRITALFPGRFAATAQLPQVAGQPIAEAVEELRRVAGLGFVACNVNPDPSGGFWTGPPLTDPYWFPLFEAMVELNMPAMIHVSSSVNASLHTLGAHYLMADTAAYMQLVERDLFDRFPDLRLIIPHGGGAVPYHWGRFRGLAERLGRPDPAVALRENVFFDTCVYQAQGVELLVDVVGASNVLFASEMLGAVPHIVDEESGHEWDDTKRYIDALGLSREQLDAIMYGNALRVYPRLSEVVVQSA